MQFHTSAFACLAAINVLEAKVPFVTEMFADSDSVLPLYHEMFAANGSPEFASDTMKLQLSVSEVFGDEGLRLMFVVFGAMFACMPFNTLVSDLFVIPSEAVAFAYQ